MRCWCTVIAMMIASSPMLYMGCIIAEISVNGSQSSAWLAKNPLRQP